MISWILAFAPAISKARAFSACSCSSWICGLGSPYLAFFRIQRFVLENELYLTEHNYCAREIGIKQPLFGVLSRNIRIHLFQQNVGEKARTVPAFRSSNSSVRAFG